MANKISTVLDLNTKGFLDGLRSTRTAVSEADGWVNKLKVGAGGLKDSVGSFLKSGAGMAAVAGGVAAVGAAAFKATSEYADLGIEVGKFADATGLSADEASRWIEVAGDIGIESGTVEKSIGFMNKTLGKTPGAFEKLGVEIAKTKDGSVDANGTFLSVIGTLNGIKDPAKRAEAGTRLLGRGWQEMAELIGKGSASLTESLKAVDEQKVFDDEKVAKARSFREAMDQMKDAIDEVALKLGSDALPLFKDLIGVLGTLIGVIGNVYTGFKDVTGVLDFMPPVLDDITSKLQAFKDAGTSAASETDRETRRLVSTMGEVTTETDAAAAAALDYKHDAANTARAVKQNIDEMIGKWAELRGDVEDDQAWLTLQGQFDEVRIKFEEANAAVLAGTEDAEQKTRDYAMALNDLTLDTINYGEKVAGLPPEKVVLIKAAIQEGDIERAEEMLAILTRNRNINIGLIGKGAPGFDSGLSGARAHGGPVSPGGAYLVGEDGPEVLQMGGQGGNVIPNDKLGGGSGGPISVTINMPPGSNGDDVVRAIKKYETRNGPGWRS